MRRLAPRIVCVAMVCGVLLAPSIPALAADGERPWAENVSPAKVVGKLMAEPEISQAVIAGDGRSSITALVVPAEGHDDVSTALAVNRVNLRLSVTERIRRHIIVAPFTVENGLLTPTHKIRRMLVIRANTEHSPRPLREGDRGRG